jgi:hypothetical protein
MAIKVVERKVRATLASKIAGSKRRQRAYRRDLRGRFSIAQATPRSDPAFSGESKKAIRKVRPSSAISGRTSGIPRRSKKLKR